MTDREMLELAARGAGIDFNKNRSITGRDDLYCTNQGWWNPLTDDGDALRLAVTLGLFESIDFHFRLCGAQSQDDPYAATRLTITRAAAEIGRNMK